MKKSILLLAVMVANILGASNVITYMANGKLSETTESGYNSGLHINAFNVSIVSHDFNNRQGTITFAGEVTTIGDYAFFNTSITDIAIPASVTTIGACAFAMCYNLTTLTIPSTVTSIGNYAFANIFNVAYMGSATYDQSDKYWGAKNLNAYEEGYLTYSDYTKTTIVKCSQSVKGSIVIPNTVTSIADNAFESCSGLTSVTLPASLISIGQYAFAYCHNLTSIFIPAQVTSIGERAFYSCDLTAINVDASNLYYSSVDGVLYNFAKNILIQYPKDKRSTSITIPNTVHTISNGAFTSSYNLQSVTIPTSVTTIGEYAFSYCKSITTLYIPNSVTSIGYNAFYDIANISYYGTATYEQYDPYWGAKYMNGYVDGNLIYSDYSMTTLVGCTKSARGKVVIPNTVTYIGEGAFKSMYDITSIFIPSSVLSIGDGAFQYCGLEAFDVDPANPYYTSVDGVLLNRTQDILIQYPRYKERESYTIPATVRTIGDYAFNGSSYLIDISIPYSVTSIGTEAFANCYNLTSLTIPNTVTSIGEYAFSGIFNIIYNGSATYSTYNQYWGAQHMNAYIEGYLIYPDQSKTIVLRCLRSAVGAITIPNSVISIETGAFYNCNKITSITIPYSVTSIGRSYPYMSNLTAINVAAANPNFASVEGVLFSKTKDTLIYYPAGNARTSYAIPYSTKIIGDYAVSDCRNLTSVTIPASVTTIGECAFAYCNMSSMNIPNTVTSIGYRAFAYIYNINYYGSATYGQNDEYWGAETMNAPMDGNFIYSDNTRTTLLKCLSTASGDISVPNTVTTIAAEAFVECHQITSVTIPASVTSIGGTAFAYSFKLQAIYVDPANRHYASVDGVLYNYAQDTLILCPMGNTRTSYTVPNSVKVIDLFAFYYDTCLTSITIPASVQAIGEEAFYMCSNLSTINCYPTTPPVCDVYCFDEINESAVAYVPMGTLDLYQQAAEWKDLNLEVRLDPYGMCGDNLTWMYADGVLNIRGTGAMYDYDTSEAPWLTLFSDSITSIVIANGATYIGKYAFAGCSNKNFKTCNLPNSVTMIGDYAFAYCTYLKKITMGTAMEEIQTMAFKDDQKLIDITCYTIEPPTLATDAFANYDARLQVPCEAVGDYKVSVGWKLFNKDNVSCIGAEEQSTTEVVVTPSDNAVTITWPTHTNAAEYTIEIQKEGQVFCTLTFNADGQLTNIAFAPGRGADNSVAATTVAGGYRFTITSLNPATTYAYYIDTQSASGKSVQSFNGTFTTTGLAGINDIESISSSSKFLLHNTLYIERGGHTYNLQGIELK